MSGSKRLMEWEWTQREEFKQTPPAEEQTECNASRPPPEACVFVCPRFIYVRLEKWTVVDVFSYARLRTNSNEMSHDSLISANAKDQHGVPITIQRHCVCALMSHPDVFKLTVVLSVLVYNVIIVVSWLSNLNIIHINGILVQSFGRVISVCVWAEVAVVCQSFLQVCLRSLEKRWIDRLLKRMLCV